ncbi:DUF1929-domain-containing protein [Fistulina hepatica ATCC 64428]|uniref:DUF1929-domain-containing protein n=1 Tax=Fistulina hepatica ATCC 64428 TaxID=1128425 RepID=A0A0D7AIR1_9AGAR|nr:DUF1929-domain-containing protein [Fistulina hepatica ATCC 64428]
MFVGNEEKVYILDKAEGNAEQIDGHPAWGSVWDFNTHDVETMAVRTNVFCASGMHLPNGSYVTFGGNGAVGKGGDVGNVLNTGGGSAYYDTTYEDYDGGKAIRILNPCTSANNMSSEACQWFDNPSLLSMSKRRWYSAAEPLANGTVAIIGGFVNGGYINRNTPNTDPEYEGGAAEPTYEFYPSNGQTPQVMNFMITTSGLNSYAHTFLMPSGKMFVQANVSTMLWDYDTNTETILPDMPNNVVRVYPGSGAVAMLPLTPANNYTPTILFCGGNDMPEADWGNYSWPVINTFYYPASKDCHRITPEPLNGSSPEYVADDDLLESRTMGQFIILPDGKLLIVNGGLNGTAGYSTQTDETLSYSDMPYGMSLAAGPVGQPALYDPNAAQGSRWSRPNFDTSSIARLYHSSAILLPDASVLIAGSNPNVDVNLTTYFPTQYKAEIFYPSYFSASTRPVPTGVPQNLTYGGHYFDIDIPGSSYSGSSDDAAENSTVVLIRPGWTTHAMNMGQRFMQLNNTYTVNSNGSITLHVAQVHPNPNLFQPGPAFLFVTVNGIPSNGTLVIVGNGEISTQETYAASTLPTSVRSASATGNANGSSSVTSSASSSSSSGGTYSSRSVGTGTIVGAVVGALAAVGVVGALVGIWVSRRRRAENRAQMGRSMANKSSAYPEAVGGVGLTPLSLRGSETDAAFLQHGNNSHTWDPNTSTADFNTPYTDHHNGSEVPVSRARDMGMSIDYDPYARDARMSTSTPPIKRY